MNCVFRISAEDMDGRGRRTWTLGTRFWRHSQIKKTVPIVPPVEPFVALALLNLVPFDALLMLLKILYKIDSQLPKKLTRLILFEYNIHSVKLQIESNGIARVRRKNELRWNYSAIILGSTTTHLWANYNKANCNHYIKIWNALNKEKAKMNNIPLIVYFNIFQQK